MDDIIFNIRQSIRVLNEAHSSVQSIWRDNAAREVSSRYIDPMFDAANQIQINNERLKDTLEEAIQFRNIANEDCEEARELATHISEFLKEIASELGDVANQIAAIDSGITQVQTDCDVIRDLLNQANIIGNSAPARTPPRPEPGLIWEMVYRAVSGAIDTAASGIDGAVNVTTGMVYKLTGADESN